MKKSGEILFAPQFAQLDFFSQCYLSVVGKTGEGLLDQEGVLVVDTVYDGISKYDTDGVIYAAKKDRLWGFIDLKGNTVIDHKYKKQHSFTNKTEFAAVLDQNQWYLIDKRGERISDESYTTLYTTKLKSGKGYLVQKGVKWGIIDLNGVEVLPFFFDEMELYRKGSWKVTLEEFTFYINESMECIQDCPSTDLLEKYKITIKEE